MWINIASLDKVLGDLTEANSKKQASIWIQDLAIFQQWKGRKTKSTKNNNKCTIFVYDA